MVYNTAKEKLRMKNVGIVFSLFIVLALLAGCGSNGSTDASPGTGANSNGSGSNASNGGVEITVVSPFNDEDGNRDNFVNAYRAFEEATGNTVIDLASVSNEEWKAQINADFESGNEPDVLFYFVGADADKLVESGKLVSISDIRREFPDYASNMKDSMIPVSTANGRQYAVPVNGYWESLFLNKTVLEACEIEIPGADYTWDQFLIDCETIKENGYTPIACSLAEVPHYWFEYCTFNHGNVANHSTRPESSSDPAGQRWVAGFADITDLYQRGYFPENTLTATDSETAQLIVEDKAAFLLDGSWKVGWFEDKAANIDNYMVAYVPAKGDRKATDIVGGLSMGYYITKKAWDDPVKRTVCVEFVQAMTTDEVVSSFGVLSVTALKNGTQPPADANSFIMSALDMTRNSTGIVSAAQDLLNTEARGALFANVKNIVTGSITSAQAIDESLDM